MKGNDRIFIIRSLLVIGILILLWLVVGLKSFPFFGFLILLGFCLNTLYYLISTAVISEKRKYFFIRLLIITPFLFGIILLILKGKIKSLGGILLLAIITWSTLLTIFTKPRLIREFKGLWDFEGLKIKNLTDFLWFLTILIWLLFLLFSGFNLVRF